MNKRASRSRCRLTTFTEVKGKLSFKDIECLVVLGRDVKWRTFSFGSNLLDERESIASLLGGGLEAPETIVQAPERLPFFGA